MKFKAVCSKENQKLTISLEAESVDIARETLHKQGYSIIEINIDTAEGEWWNFFFFDIRVDGLIKSWQIQSNDIFKAYKKLVQDLGHDVVYIYTTKNMPEEQKMVITAKVKSGYDLYLQSTRTKEQDEQDIEDERKDVNADVYNQISVETKKEIDKYNKIIDSIIEKIQNIFIKYHDTLLPEKKTKLEEVQQALYQSKSGTNVGKIKLIAETALLKIGEFELELAKLEVWEERKKFFESTNKLLKEVGSKSKFEIKEEKQLPPFILKIKSIFQKISEKAQEIEASNPEQKDTKKTVDKSSFVFYKNLRELKIYKDLLKKTEILIFKNIVHLQFSEVKRLSLKRKLLYQNIQIIENRINNKNFSYTKIIRGADYYIHVILRILAYLGDILLYWLLIYAIFFTLYFLGDRLKISLQIKDDLLFFISILSGFVVVTRFYRNIIAFTLWFLTFLFFIFFLSINF